MRKTKCDDSDWGGGGCCCCTIIVVGDNVMHCSYVHNALMLNCEIYCPCYESEVKAFYQGGGVKYDHILNRHFSYANRCLSSTTNISRLQYEA